MAIIHRKAFNTAKLHDKLPRFAGWAAIFLIAGFSRCAVAAEAPLPDSPGVVVSQQSGTAAEPPALTDEQKEAQIRAEHKGEQSKRIFGILPNFRSVSVDDKFIPLTPGEKLKLSLKNSFDYSSFIASGLTSGISQWRDSHPEFRQGAAGYGRRYWHSFTDQALASTTTVFLLPVLTHEDPRYFTLGHGTFKERSRYAITRVFITRSDSGKNTANISEIGGRASYAGLSVLYYPAHYQTASEAAQRFGLAVGFDAGANLAKEFWPDLRAWMIGEKKVKK